MQFEIFSIPYEGGAESVKELNQFIRQHQVVTVNQKVIRTSAGEVWSFCVEYMDGTLPEVGDRVTSKRHEKVDYREKLSAEDFAVYLQMREWRKSVAEREKVPVYVICTNDILAQIVENRCSTRADLLKIQGFGEGKADRYGEDLLAALRNCDAQGIVDVQDFRGAKCAE